MNPIRRRRSSPFRFVSVASGIALTCWPLLALGVTYEPGDWPTIDPFSHMTAMGPDPQSRTDIGIREWVYLQIDENTWHDDDIMIDEQGNQSVIPDGMGDVYWYADKGEFLFPVGNTTTFIAPWSEFETWVSVLALVWDSGLLGIDPPVIHDCIFSVLIPTGVRPFFVADAPMGTPGPPDQSMGVVTQFAIQVLPDWVNFRGIKIWEVIPPQTFQWPIGTNYVVPAFEKTVGLDFLVIGGEIRHNCFFDVVGTGGPWDVSNLTDPLTGQPVDAEFPVEQRLLFQTNDSPELYKQFELTTHPRKFSGTNFKSQVGWITFGGTDAAWTQTPQGPYKEQGKQ